MSAKTTCYPSPSVAEQQDFLLSMYFGFGNDDVVRACGAAYLDLSRTVHGIGGAPKVEAGDEADANDVGKPRAKIEGQRVLIDSLKALPDNPSVVDQESFDQWHETQCKSLCDAFAKNGYGKFTIGQAQKWLNMSIKYIFLFGEGRLPGYARFYRYAHVPIDNVVLQAEIFQNVVSNSGLCLTPWSRIDNYSKVYLPFQQKFRAAFPCCSPLAVEFHEWLRAQRSSNGP